MLARWATGDFRAGDEQLNAAESPLRQCAEGGRDKYTDSHQHCRQPHKSHSRYRLTTSRQRYRTRKRRRLWMRASANRRTKRRRWSLRPAPSSCRSASASRTTTACDIPSAKQWQLNSRHVTDAILCDINGSQHAQQISIISSHYVLIILVKPCGNICRSSISVLCSRHQQLGDIRQQKKHACSVKISVSKNTRKP